MKPLAELDWARHGIDLVFECTGAFGSRADAMRHLARGAHRVLFSQPADTDIDATIVYGINHRTLDGSERVVSAASCSTNCIVPVIDTLARSFGVECGVITTIHSAMNDQPVLDAYHHTDLRKTRAALQSIIPVDTGLGAGIGRILPALAGTFRGAGDARANARRLGDRPLGGARRDTTVQRGERAARRGGGGSGWPGSSATPKSRSPPATSTTTRARASWMPRRPVSAARPAAQGADLVRQRVGIREPHARCRAILGRGGPYRDRKRWLETGSDERETDDRPRPARQARADPRGSERAGEGRQGQQRRAHPRRAAHHPHGAGEGRARAPDVAPRAPEGGRQRRGKAAVQLAPVAARLGELLGRPVPLVRDWLDGVDSRPAHSCCARTCASTRARSRTTKRWHGAWRRCATST
jgi:hypothetical protein